MFDMCSRESSVSLCFVCMCGCESNVFLCVRCVIVGSV